MAKSTECVKKIDNIISLFNRYVKSMNNDSNESLLSALECPNIKIYELVIILLDNTKQSESNDEKSNDEDTVLNKILKRFKKDKTSELSDLIKDITKFVYHYTKIGIAPIEEKNNIEEKNDIEEKKIFIRYHIFKNTEQGKELRKNAFTDNTNIKFLSYKLKNISQIFKS